MQIFAKIIGHFSQCGAQRAARHRRRLVAAAAAAPYCCCVAGRVAATDKPQLAQLSPVV